MMDFHINETAIIDADIGFEPDTSVQITISDGVNGVEIKDQNMVHMGNGKYQYDYNPAGSIKPAEFWAVVTAIHGTRKVVEPITFKYIEAAH